jgi:hypothetical protein
MKGLFKSHAVRFSDDRKSLLVDGRLESGEVRAGDVSQDRLQSELWHDRSDSCMEKIEKDTDRDFFMTAEQAKDYGIVDAMISTKPTNWPVAAEAALTAIVTPKGGGRLTLER